MYCEKIMPASGASLRAVLGLKKKKAGKIVVSLEATRRESVLIDCCFKTPKFNHENNMFTAWLFVFNLIKKKEAFITNPSGLCYGLKLPL